jgi:hypothetical protein
MLTEDDMMLFVCLLRKVTDKESRKKLLASLTDEEVGQVRDYLASLH